MKSSMLPLFIGVLCLVGGVLAIRYPFASSLAVETFAGWLFAVAGAAGIFSALQQPSNRFLPAFFGLVLLVFGAFLIARPMEGVMTLSALVATSLIVSGVLRLIWARLLMETTAFWMILISGAISVLVGAMIFAKFPQTENTILGVVLGIELIMIAIPLALSGRPRQ